jgi:hypothetical protein
MSRNIENYSQIGVGYDTGSVRGACPLGCPVCSGDSENCPRCQAMLETYIPPTASTQLANAQIANAQIARQIEAVVHPGLAGYKMYKSSKPYDMFSDQKKRYPAGTGVL